MKSHPLALSSAVVFGLALLAISLAGCTSGSQSDRTPGATASTPAATSSQSAAPTGQAQVTLPQWDSEKRTGVEDIDSVIAAVTSGQSAPLLALANYEMVGCGPAGSLNPACQSDEPSGTEVEALHVSDCADRLLRKSDVPAFAAKVVPGNVYAVFRDTSGNRQLIFDRETDGGFVSRVTLDDSGAIVGLAVSCESGVEGEPGRFDMLKAAQTIYPYAPDRFILPPPK